MKLPYIRRRKRTPRKHRSSFPKKNKEEDAKALSSLPSGQSQAEKQQEETLRLSARIGRQSSRSRTLSVPSVYHQVHPLPFSNRKGLLTHASLSHQHS